MWRPKRPRGLPKRIPARWWKAFKLPGRFHWRKPKAFWAWRKWREHRKHVKPKPAMPVVMYDDVNVSLIPKTAPAVAGYIGGRWPTYPKVVSGWPTAKHLSIAVASIYNADALDIEPGDAPVSLAAEWVKKQLALRTQGNKYNTTRPVVYTSASWGQNLVNTLEKAGLKYDQDFMWWSAHYDPAKGKHICDPSCGFGIKVRAHATQWTDHADNKSLDESLVVAGFFA